MHPYSDFYSHSVTIGMVIAVIVLIVHIIMEVVK